MIIKPFPVGALMDNLRLAANRDTVVFLQDERATDRGFQDSAGK